MNDQRRYIDGWIAMRLTTRYSREPGFLRMALEILLRDRAPLDKFLKKAGVESLGVPWQHND
jgi:hypothetical protein